MDIREKTFKIIVRANAGSNEITGFDDSRKAYRINIAAKAEDNKANIEIIKFFRKELKKDVKIVSGLKRREKIIKIED